MQFELRSYHRFHASYAIKSSTACQELEKGECFSTFSAFLSSRRLKAGGHPERFFGEREEGQLKKCPVFRLL
jgi:hypothetical protein